MPGSGNDFQNFHGTSIVVDDVGIFIQGPSGSGKTSLALGLLDVASARGLPAKLICDDQTLMMVENEKIIAKSPESIRGMAEITGFGISRIPPSQQVQTHPISLVASLVDDANIQRMPERETTLLLGQELPHCQLPKRHEAQAIRILLAAVHDWF